MSPTRRNGRRVPPKGRASRPAAPGEFDAIDAEVGDPAQEADTAPAARTTRAQNRAAKRAASGVRPKAVRGQTRGRASRQTNTAVLVLAVAAVAVGAAVLAFGNPFGSAEPSPSATAAGGSPYGDGTCPTTEPDPLAAGQVEYVTIATELGDIVIEVDGDLAPYAAGNFIALAECAYYDGVVFHRTAALQDGTPFVIQGGDPQGTGIGGPGYTIRDEAVTTPYERGTVAMARTSQPNSQGSQFFIVLSEAAGPVLQSANTYAIFGKVVSGMSVADAIFADAGGEELPADPVAMTTVTVSDVPPSAEPTATPSATPGVATPEPSPAP